MDMIKCPECKKEFIPKDRRQVYCTPQCRYRKYRRKIEAKRIEEGKCPKCGGVMDRTGKASYCSKCKEYWKVRYRNERERGMQRKIEKEPRGVVMHSP